MDKLTKYLIEPFIEKEVIEEGARDPGIFKAIFLAGGPGSGKSFVAQKLFGIPEKINVSKTGLKMVNQDSEFELLLNKYFGTTDVDNMPDELFADLTGVDKAGKPVDYATSGLRKYAKALSQERLRIYTEGKLGVIIDGTGHKYGSIADKKKKLEKLGYDCYMVFVNTSLDVAMERNEKRDRVVPASIVRKSWQDVQNNMGAFQGLFGSSNFLIVSNNKRLSDAQIKKHFKMLVSKGIDKFLKKPPKNPIAKKWLRREKKHQKIFKDPGQSKFFESIKLPVEVGDTILMGRFKNKKVVVKSIDYNDNGDLLINGRPALKFRIMESINESDVKAIHKLLTQYGKSASKATAMIRKNYNKVKKQFKGDSVRDLAMALIGYDVIGENKELFKMYTQAMKMMPGSPKQKELIKKISSLRKKLKMNEAPRKPRKKGQHRQSSSHSDLYTDENPKGTIKGLKFATVKDAQASVSKIKSSGKSHAHKIQAAVAMEQRAREMGKASQAAVYRAYINKMKKKTKAKNEEFGAPAGMLPSPSRKSINKMKKKGNSSVPYGSGYKKMNENKNIKKTIGVFGGRFQPFHSGHLATYKWLSKQVDEAYITTSNIKQPPRHPMDFKEKVRHMVKMGIPKNRIVQERTPYVAENLLKKFNPDTTAVVYAFGAKDAGRLGSGKKKSGGLSYYQDYKKSKGNIKGFDEHGYFLTAPQQGSMSGTQMRDLLGNPKYDDSEKQKTFKKVFGYYDKGIYNMMTNKFKKLFETYTLSDDLIKEFLIEASTTVNGNLDDGPSTFHKDYSEYVKVSTEWINSLYSDAGWAVMDYIIRDGARNSIKDAYKSVPLTYLDHGQAKGSSTAVNKYKKWMSDVIEPLGWDVVSWMGTSAAIDNIIGSLFAAGANATEYLPNEFKVVETFSKDWWKKELLLEGGAYGHLNHPFDDKNLTFSDFKTLIINTLQGNLDKEGPVTEKTDGQNIMISWKNGKLVAARNKGHIKNFGANALDISGIKNMFSGRGDIEKAFVSAMSDLQKALKGLSKKQKDKVFAEGKKFMSLEVIYPATSNVIPYDKSLLQFHGTIEYNSAGSPIGEDRGSARMLAGMIKQINQNVQKTYSITKPFITQLPVVKNFSQKQSYFLGKLKKLQDVYKLNDSATLSDYHQAYWMEYIYNGAKNTDYPNPSNDVLMNLTKRWAFFDKSYKIPQIKKDLQDYPKFLDWVLSTDKMDHAKLQKQHIRDWEVLFFELGAEILSNLQDFIAANPSKAAQTIRKDLKKAIDKVKQSKDPKVLNTLKTQLDRLNAIGGLKAVVPTEGITFVFKGKVYKYTGAFAPANQILGMLKFV